MSGYRLIDLPKPFATVDYDRTIEQIVNRIAQSDAVQSIYQIGGVSAPGISDIDLIVVFDDGATFEVDPREGLDNGQRYLAVHDVFGTCETLFARSQDYTFYHNYKLLYGREQPLGSNLAEEDVAVLQSHIALEYMHKMFITLTLQRDYNVLRVRDLFLHVNAIQYDLEFLGITEGRLHRLTGELIQCRRTWFTESISRGRLRALVDSFYDSLADFLNSPGAIERFFFPYQGRQTVSKNIFVSPSKSQLKARRSGLRVPAYAGLLGKLYFKAQNRLNTWHFTLPAQSSTPPPVLSDRFRLMDEILDYNARHLPHFFGLLSGLSFRVEPEPAREAQKQLPPVQLAHDSWYLEPWEASIVSHLVEEGVRITFVPIGTQEPAESRLSELWNVVLQKRTHIRLLLPDHAIVAGEVHGLSRSNRRVLCLGSNVLQVPGEGVLYHLLIGDGVGRPAEKEIARGRDAIRARVVRWSNGSQEVVRDGWVKCFLHSRTRTLNLVADIARRWLAELLLSPADGSDERGHGENEVGDAYGGSTYATSRFAYLLGAATRQFGRLQRTFKSEDWNVGLVAEPISRFLESDFRPDVSWLPAPPKGLLHADPFGLQWNDRLVVFIERGRLHERAGISYMEVFDGEVTEPIPAFELPWHLSYPSLIRYDGRVFCIPSAEDSGSVIMLEAIDFPRKWSQPVALLEGVPGIDPTVVQWHDRWWMFLTRKDYMDNHELFIYHAERFDGTWYPHAGNPVKTDIRGARPAGTPFIADGQLIRPSQDSSREYGGRTIMNQIVELTPERFLEEPVRSVEPVSPYSSGLHHIASCGDVTLVDGKRNTLKALRVLGGK